MAHLVTFTCRAGAYERTMIVPVWRDDVHGFDAIEEGMKHAYQNLPARHVANNSHGPIAPIERVYDELALEQIPYLELHAGKFFPKRCYIEDTDLRGPEWLKEFVVKAEILEG